jgi:hypothetical protein
MPVSGLFERLAARVSTLLLRDPDLHVIQEIVAREQVDPDSLAAAYWHSFYATYLPKEAWNAMPRGRRRAVYRKRLRIVAAFAALPPDLRAHVAVHRPPPPFH